MTAPENLVDRPSAEAATTPEEGLAPAATHARPRAVQLGGPAIAVGVVAAWLVLRPQSPQGAAAVVDLLLLPALLFVEARLLAGRPTISWAGFSILFGLGAVLATVAALVLESAAEQVLGRAALGPFGSVVEVVAPAVPVVVVAVLLLRAACRPTMTDLALAGLASGLGFLVVQTSLVTAASHRAPHYASPLVAGWQRVAGPEGADPAYFVGPGVATALLGLAIGASIRWQAKPWRLAPPLFALCLLGMDRAIFDRQLRRVITGDSVPSSSVVDVLQRLTFSGRLELGLVVIGLVLAGRSARLWDIASRSRSRGSAAGADEPGAPHEVTEDTEDTEVTDEGGAEPEVAHPTPPERIGAPPAVPGGALGIAVLAGAAFVVLARTGDLRFLQERPVALAVSIAGLGYSVLRLAALRSSVTSPPEMIDLDEEPPAVAPSHEASPVQTDEGRQLLCVAAMAASVSGIVSSFLPEPAAVRPIHGALVLDAVQGWASNVGHLGLLLGIAAMAAPPGRVRPRSPGGWRDVLPWRMRASGSWRGLSPRTYRVGWSEFWRLGSSGRPGGRLGWSGFWRLRKTAGGDGGGGRSPADRLGWRGFWRMMQTPVGGGARGGRSGGRLPWRSGRWRPIPIPDEPGAKGPTITIAIEPVEESVGSRVEYEGATVQEAMQAALRHLDLGMAGTSLQLVDEGIPPKPGKAGSGRPARVRVSSGREEADPLLPPGRDSIARTTPVAVVVELVDVTALPSAVDSIEVVTGSQAASATTIEVTITNPARSSESRTLTGHREEVTRGRIRYRTNSYTVDAGEDQSWFPTAAPAAKAMKIRDGEQLCAEFGGHASVVTVYDSWTRQVLGINGAFFDAAGAHHVTALAALEQQGPDPQHESSYIAWIRNGLAAVDEGRRLLSSSAPDDEKAFLSTAVLHRALCHDGGSVDAEAAAALEEHRRMVGADPHRDTPTGPYRRLLDTTVVGRLWADGASSTEELGALLGWTRVSARNR